MELLRGKKKLSHLGVLVLLAVSCCLSCRTRLRLGESYEADGGWPMLGGNIGHTGLYSSSLSPPLRLLWRFRTKGPIVASPAVSGGVVCLGSLDKRLYLLSAYDGQLHGFLKMASGISASPAVGGHIVYFATEFGDAGVYALDFLSGDLCWKANIADVSASLTLAFQMVLVSSGSGSFHALSAEDGRELWRFSTGGRVGSAAAVGGEMVYFGSDDGILYALEVESGREVWRRELGGAIWSSPMVYEGQIYVGCFDGKIYAVRGENGEVMWTFQTGAGISCAPAACDSMLYVGSDDGRLYALDVASGASRWSFTVGNPITGSSLVSPQMIIFGASDGVIYALDSQTGQLLWNYQTGRAVVSAPAAWDDRVFISSMDGYLYAFEAGEGDSSAIGQAIP